MDRSSKRDLSEGSSCMNVIHGCRKAGALYYRPEMEPHGKFAEEGGLVPNPPTGGLIQSQYLNKTEEEHLKI